MKQRLSLVTFLILISSLACTLTAGSVQPTVEPVSGKPSVAIKQPLNGALFAVGDTITVQVEASDPEGTGVTRVDLLVNNVIVDSQTSQNPLGESSLSVLLDYIAAVANPGLSLSVRAYRGISVSDDVSVNVVINASGSGNSNTGANTGTNGSGPAVAPPTYDPVCRARVDVKALNFREGPSVDYRILSRFSLGDETPLVGRLGDNSWWEVTSNGLRGWVSSAYTSLLGDCDNIAVSTPPASPTPAATFTPTPAPNAPADLVISTFAGATSIDLVGGEAVSSYIIRVKNVGGTAAGSFNATLFFPDGRAWDYTVSGLAPGEETTIESVTVTFSTPGSYRLEVFADSSNNIPEASEQNNREYKDVVVADSPQP